MVLYSEPPTAIQNHPPTHLPLVVLRFSRSPQILRHPPTPSSTKYHRGLLWWLKSLIQSRMTPCTYDHVSLWYVKDQRRRTDRHKKQSRDLAEDANRFLYDADRRIQPRRFRGFLPTLNYMGHSAILVKEHRNRKVLRVCSFNGSDCKLDFRRSQVPMTFGRLQTSTEMCKSITDLRIRPPPSKFPYKKIKN